MTQDEIIKLAREAGSCSAVCEGCDNVDVLCGNSLERFAALVAEAKDKEIAELYQMCLNQAMTIKKYSDKFGELK
jgi:hypothetical protein